MSEKIIHEKIIREIKEKFGSPVFVFDTDEVRRQIKNTENAFHKRVKLCYAMKANPFLIGEIDDWISYFEVCSPGERKICKRGNIDVNSIVISGVNKEESDIEEAVKDGISLFTIESHRQYELLKGISEKYEKNLKVLIRFTSGNQFGVSLEDLYEIAGLVKKDEYLMLEGIQLYSGTQKRKADELKKEINLLDEIYIKLKEEHGIVLDKIEYGPGLFIPYFINDKDINEEMTVAINETISNMHFKGEIVFEMGRYLAGSCGNYITCIADIKVNDGVKYIIADGGINHLNYFGQTMAMKVMNFKHYSEQRTGKEEKCTICGSLCTTADVILRNAPLKSPAVGDILVFEKTGAYTVTEGIYMFLSRDMPKIIFYSENGGLELVRDRFETNKLNFKEI